MGRNWRGRRSRLGWGGKAKSSECWTQQSKPWQQFCLPVIAALTDHACIRGPVLSTRHTAAHSPHRSPVRGISSSLFCRLSRNGLREAKWFAVQGQRAEKLGLTPSMSSPQAMLLQPPPESHIHLDLLGLLKGGGGGSLCPASLSRPNVGLCLPLWLRIFSAGTWCFEKYLQGKAGPKQTNKQTWRFDPLSQFETIAIYYEWVLQKDGLNT